MIRALVTLAPRHSLVTMLADGEACETVEWKGGRHEIDRKRTKTGTRF